MNLDLLGVSAVPGDKIVGCRTQRQGEKDMFGMIAAVLIVLWLLGFFAFHVTSGFIHIVLVAGIILLILHFFTGRSATV